MAFLVSDTPPCVLFEDEHLLAVNKPPGLTTHAPSPYASEGLYDWFRHREPRWATLAIQQRLDKDTSGVLVFSKTPLAHRSLAEQFARRAVRKKYLLWANRPLPASPLEVRSKLLRLGERFRSTQQQTGIEATTRFRRLHRETSGCFLIQAEPLTGRTHQIRVHAAEQGFPIVGDRLYGGASFPRLCLHSLELTLQHPATGESLTLRAQCDFNADPRIVLREALWSPTVTQCHRVLHGAAEGAPGWYVDRFGEYLLSLSAPDHAPPLDHAAPWNHWRRRYSIRGIYHKALQLNPAQPRAGASPRLIEGQPAPASFPVMENGLQFALSFAEGYSIGLFLDQRDNRRRLLTGHVAAGFPLFTKPADAARVLNTFAYTCAFSACAAKAGSHVTSLDLSRKYLQWGHRNFELNGLDFRGHDFIYGDVFDWMQRLARKRRTFDLVLLDPPTFSRSKEHGVFQVEKDYPRLIALALPLLNREGVLFASTNSSRLQPGAFLEKIRGAVEAGGRQVRQEHYAPQPPDFPITREEPAHLKTMWLRVE